MHKALGSLPAPHKSHHGTYCVPFCHISNHTCQSLQITSHRGINVICLRPSWPLPGSDTLPCSLTQMLLMPGTRLHRCLLFQRLKNKEEKPPRRDVNKGKEKGCSGPRTGEQPKGGGGLIHHTLIILYLCHPAAANATSASSPKLT